MRRWLAATNERSSGLIVCWGTFRKVSSSTSAPHKRPGAAP
jgi:hypothetical protein